MPEMYQHPSMPYRPGIGHQASESVEDFRSVIDDLTIANKKLKQKLRKYEKLHDAHLQDEKLFEVRFHGLPDHKKRELEETLRKFAADLDNTSEQEVPVIASHPPPFDQQKTASSASRFAESGYASMSGHNSNSTRSNQPSNTTSGNDRDRRRMTKSQYNQQQQSIQSYLHDIPHGLLPKNHSPMTEKSKKRMVVRRLEQIFAGKRSTPGNHPQPMQQEEVAQSAATADRQAREAAGQRMKTEGNREARIMPVQADDEDITGQQEVLQKLRPSLHVNEQDFAGSGSPDQRPTRPLDLDLYRAQVPFDNMEYIRHLGFTPPHMISGDSPEDRHGWIYLNLLINMAQLHTLNVTPDFVKESVTEYSSLFELSHDGRKIRWKGGPNATLSSNGSSSEYQSNDSPEMYGSSRSPSKYTKTAGSGSTDPTINPERAAKRLARLEKEKERNKFSYTPLFFHKEESDDENDSYGLDMGSSSNSPFQRQQAGDSSGFGSSAMQSSSSKRRRNDGPMIFYSKAKFCTDLTGDSRGIASHTSDTYQNITSQPIGVPTPRPARTLRQLSDTAEPRGPLDTTSLMDVDSDAGIQMASSSDDMRFSPDSLRDNIGTPGSNINDFEASGIGGVHPEDNFSIRVRRSQLQTGPGDHWSQRRKSRFYAKRILEALNEPLSPDAEPTSPKQQPIIKEEIISASRHTLPNSTLPPASFLPFDSTSSGDVDSDLESDVSSSASTNSSSEKIAMTALQQFAPSPVGRNSGYLSSEESSEEDSESDDGSIDLLATARQMDPRTIIASEREYDAALADRLAEDIPAGSSAATAGGGSGFNSPEDESALEAINEDGDSPVKRNKLKRQSTESGSLSSRAKLKRNRTREAIATALQSSKGLKSQKRESPS